jgi:hypothetical protein
MSDDEPVEEPTPDERDLLAELAGALADPADAAGLAELVERCEGLLSWIDVDHELAALLGEAVAEPPGTRGSATTGSLVFRLDDGSVTLEVTVGRDSIEGRVVAGQPVDAVTCEHATDAARTAAVGELGEFRLDGVRSGPARLRIDPPDGPPIRTDWFTV